MTLPTPDQFDEVSHSSGLPTRAAELGAGYDDALLFWALRNSYLLRERISIVDLADLLGADYREGRYLLRTTLTEEDPVKLWEYYI